MVTLLMYTEELYSIGLNRGAIEVIQQSVREVAKIITLGQTPKSQISRTIETSSILSSLLIF